MRSIPRVKQGRAAFELHNASVSMLMSPSSYGVYTGLQRRKEKMKVLCMV